MRISLAKPVLAIACVACFLVAVLAPATAVRAQDTGTIGSTAGLESVLAQSLAAGREAAEEQKARLDSPAAIAEDARSRTAFSGDKRSAAIALAKSTFGIDRPDWVAPQSELAGKLVGYVGEHMAGEVLPDGQHELIASSLPLRSAIGTGAEQPVSLELQASGSGYEPANPVVPVVLGKSAAEGASFGYGLRMIPVAHAAPEGSEVVGNSVFYPGTAKGTDYILQPRVLGLEASWQLLSAESSGENALSFSLPAGAILALSDTIEGAAEVSLEGQTLLNILPAVASEANGASLPVSYTVNGDVLTTHVDLSGDVQFPVDVDPVVEEKFGGGSGFWDEELWHSSISAKGGKVIGAKGQAGVAAEVEPGAPGESFASWGLFAPGFWAGEGSITRMDVTGLEHKFHEESNIQTEIVGKEGKEMPDPSYTYDGEIAADTHKGKLETREKIGAPKEEGGPGHGVDAAFCAQEEPGGYDGGAKPLCNESVGGEYYRLTVDNWDPPTHEQWVQIEGNTGTFLDTSNIKAAPSTAAEINRKTNVLAGSGEKWLSEHSGALEAIGSDPAFGVSRLTVTIAGKSVTHEYAKENDCYGIRCAPEEKQPLTYANFPEGLPNGEDAIKIEAEDASGLTAIWNSTVLVDNAPPHGLTVSAADMSGKTITITEGQADDQISAEASDGENKVRSAGIEHIGLEIDGKQVGQYEGACAPGPCTGRAKWTLNNRELGAGTHTLIVRAMNNIGREIHEEYVLNVDAATPIAMGPGSVNPQSGDFALESTDVDLKDSDGALSLTQHYDSRNVNEGAEGPLGPEWAIGLGQLATLEVQEKEGHLNGILVVGPEGFTWFVQGANGVFDSKENPELKLTSSEDGKAYVLENKKTGNATTFTQPSGAKHWMPTSSTTAGSTNTLTDSYKSIEVGAGKVIVEPTEELAPHTRAKCPTERKQLLADEQKEAEACRALFFYYENEAKEGEELKQQQAKGENASEWGWYAHRLRQVVAVMWSTAAGKMEEVPVAEFSYDSQGRLRAEWDPRIKPVLKTTYGYNSEDEVTAVSLPGQQPWLMSYGTIPGDSSAGRLVKVARGKASAALWVGELPEVERSGAPVISGAPAVGNRLAVSDGKWAHSPLVYGYQWERCNASGAECSMIAGAINANYTPGEEDLNHTLRVQVSATNAGGSVSTYTVASSAVKIQAAVETVHRSESVDTAGINAVSCISESTECVASDSEGNALYATNVSATAAASWQKWKGPGVSPSEAVDCPTSGLCLLADGSSDNGAGNLYYASSLGGEWKEAYSPAYGVDAISCVSAWFCLDGQNGGGYFRYSTNPKSSSWTLGYEGSGSINSVSCVSSSFCAMAGSSGSVHVATSTNQIESDSWAETKVDSHPLKGIACLSTSVCLAVDSAGNMLRMSVEPSGAIDTWSTSDLDGSNALNGVSCEGSVCVAVASNGDLYASSDDGWVWSEAVALSGDLTSVSCATEKLCLTANTSGQVTAVGISNTETGEGAQQTPQPGSTIEYDVPVTGSHAPYAMSAKDVEAWGQKDAPVEGFEVFPEEHPQEWPAKGHTGATIYYTDDEAQTVNLANPAGGISTTEYDEGEVTRTLSAVNQQRALKESNPVQAAENLSTVSKYSEEGDELSEVTGPEHKVKLASGEEVSARNHVRYFYDEGAPENEKGEVEEYGLVTKTTDGALLANGEEKDVRTTLTGYSGQEGLGWTLHAATSTTVEPQGADLVSSTRYNKETGVVEETRSPGGNAEVVFAPVFGSVFGGSGSGDGELSHPTGVAVDGSGDVWVADKDNSRIEKFTSSGVFVASYSSFDGGETFSDPEGVAVNRETGDVYVADTGNHRIVELNSSGGFVRQWGSAGSEDGEFDSPEAVAVDPVGHVWVSDVYRVQEFSASGEFIRAFGATGKGDGQFEGAGEIAFSGGMAYVADYGNNRVQEFTAGGVYVNQFDGVDGAWGIVAAPVTGDLYVSESWEGGVAEFSPDGKLLAHLETWERVERPMGLAVDAQGNVYVADETDDRVSIWEPVSGGPRMRYRREFGSQGSGAGQFDEPQQAATNAEGDVWVSDFGNDRVQEFSPSGKLLGQIGSQGSGEGQFKGPTGVAVNQSTGDIYVLDREDNRIEEFSGSGSFIRAFGHEGAEPGQLKDSEDLAIDQNGNVWVADTGNDRIQEFSATGSFIAAYGSNGTGNGQFEKPWAIAFADEHIYVADSANHRIQELSMTGSYLGQFGSGLLDSPEGIVADAAGDLYVADNGDGQVKEFEADGHYLGQFASYGSGEEQLNHPEGIAINTAGDIYVSDSGNNRLQEWLPERQSVHDTRTIYYSPGSEASIQACQNKPQWAGLPCQTEPLAQPTDSAAEPKGEQLPDLPVVTTEYNMWLQPVKTIETIGNKTRTKTTSYEGERAKSQTLEATGKPTRTVSSKYSETLGALVEQRSEEPGQETKTITQQINTLGQLESYTDAEGNATTYSYDPYGRPEEINYDASKLDHLADKERLRYQETTGQLNEIEDLGGEGTYKEAGTGTYKATYGAEGELASETYPNNMTATYAYNSIGEGTSLAYVKNNHCTGSECEWFHDTQTPSIHGEAMSQTSNLASEQYRYEQPGRLAEVKETPAGEDCTARIYTQNEEGDRTSLTNRTSSSGECTAAEGGTVERHTYDEANRNTDEGIQYEAFGNITKLPAADAGGHELTTEYYPDGQVQSQTQDEITNNYSYDPEGRTLHTETTNKLNTATTIAHYPGPGGTAPSWTYNQTTQSVNRNIAAFGGLVAVEEAGKEPLLQIRDLQGNIIGTASLSETAGKPHTLERSTEYGVPTKEKPEDKYNWLGTSGIASNLPSGAVVQDGITYVPQLGTPLQTEGTPIPAEPWTSVPIVVTASPTAVFQTPEKSKTSSEVPAGNVPGPEGEEASEGTIGDPDNCWVAAYEPYLEEGEVTGHNFIGNGEFWCRRALPSKTWFKLCFLEAGINKMHCKTINVQGMSLDEASIKMDCRVHVWYMVSAYLWHGKESGIYMRSPEGECEENLAEYAAGGEIEKVLR